MTRSQRLSRATRLVGGVVLALTLAACGAAPGGAGDYRGIELTPARPKPDFTLDAVDGTPYRFREATDGRLTLLFFGYTNCPDICPVHMANIGAALDRLTPTQRERVRVVFVTTDPERDTPERIREWLANFGHDFVGLRGPIQEVHRIEAALSLPASAPGGADEHGDYDVGHAAQVLAFTPDDSLRVLYPFGVRQQDWAEDIPKLLKVGGE